VEVVMGDEDADTIPVGGFISSGGCRERYMSGHCSCPAERCWVREAKALHARGEAAPTSKAWLAVINDERAEEPSDAG
jgi:hypothetical protein